MSQYRIELSQNVIINPVFFVTGGILGFILCICICRMDEYLRRKNIIEYIGKNSIWILCFHCLCFKLVTYIQIIKYNCSKDYLKALFTGVNIENWWIVHTIVGIFVPLLICRLYRFGRKNVKIMPKK